MCVCVCVCVCVLRHHLSGGPGQVKFQAGQAYIFTKYDTA